MTRTGVEHLVPPKCRMYTMVGLSRLWTHLMGDTASQRCVRMRPVLCEFSPLRWQLAGRCPDRLKPGNGRIRCKFCCNALKTTCASRRVPSRRPAAEHGRRRRTISPGRVSVGASCRATCQPPRRRLGAHRRGHRARQPCRLTAALPIPTTAAGTLLLHQACTRVEEARCVSNG